MKVQRSEKIDQLPVVGSQVENKAEPQCYPLSVWDSMREGLEVTL